MIKLFDIEKGKLVPTIHCETMLTLKRIKEKYPTEYLKIYMFFFYMSCNNPDENPYFDIEEIEKEAIILRELGAKFTTEDEQIKDGLKFVRQLYETPTMRAYNAIKKFLDELSDKISNTPIQLGKEGNATEIFTMATKFDSIRNSYKGLYRDLMTEQQSKSRGDAHIAYDQR